MNFVRFFRSWEGTRRLNALLGGVVLMQGIAIAGLGVLVLRQDRTVTMIPPDFHQAVSVRRGTADPAFHEAWGAYFAGVIGNVTPGNTRFVRQALESHLCPEIFHDVVTQIEREAMQMQQDRVSTRFNAQRVVYEAPTGKVFVQGQHVIDSAAGARRTSDRTFEFTLRVRDFLPQVCSVASYSGPPRTLEVIERERGSPGAGSGASTASRN
jgi:conjugal transfer pilus assembly protein TraE